MYKYDLALNDLKWLICHEAKANPYLPSYGLNSSPTILLQR